MSVYLKAARRVDDGDSKFACCAIDWAAGDGRFSPARQLFVEWFQPENYYGDLQAQAHPFWGVDDTEPRVLALLFMHWITQGGDDAPQP